MNKRSTTRVHLTCRPLQRVVLKAAPRSPGFLGFPAIAALATLLPSIGVFSALVLSFSTLDRWRLGSELYGTPSKTADVSPSCCSDWGPRVSYFQSRLPWLTFSWRTCRAPSTGGSYHTAAFSQRSRPIPRPVVLDVPALPCSALNRADDVPCSLAGRYRVPFTPTYSTVPQFQAHLSGFLPCS